MNGENETDDRLDFEVTFLKRVKTKISDELDIRDFNGGRTVLVGNTGLQIRFLEENGAYKINADFQPAGYMDAGHVAPLEAMKIFSYALKSLREYLVGLSDPEKQKISTLRSLTNPTFLNFIVRLFDKGGHGDLITVIPPRELEIDLKELMAIDESDPLFERINTFAKRAEGMQIEAMVPEDSPRN